MRISLLVGAGLLLILGALFSPFALEALVGRGKDWQLLGDVGQAYGGTSAILSALALLAVAYTSAIQIRDSRIRRHESDRLMHVELIKMALDDSTLWPSWGSNGGEMMRRLAYTNLVHNFWFHQFRAGVIKEDQLVNIAQSVFRQPLGVAYWAQSRETWKGLPNNRHETKYFNIMETAYLSAASDPVDGTAIPELDAEKPWWEGHADRRAIASVSLGAVGVLLGWLVSHKRRKRT